MRTLLLALFAALTSTGCILFGGDDDDSTGPFPETCLDVQESIVDAGDTPADGEYTLYYEGAEGTPWTAWCRGMSVETPQEYVTVDEATNFAEVTSGASLAFTEYRRYRIHTSALTIDPLDTAFAATTGDTGLVPGGLVHVPAGFTQFSSPSADDGPPSQSHVDLRGTAFSFAPSILDNDLATFFCAVTAGTNAAPNSTEVAVDVNRQQVSLSAVTPLADTVQRTVADCAGLGGATTFELASWPLQFSGE